MLNKIELLIEIVCKVALPVTPILFRAKLDESVRLRMNKYIRKTHRMVSLESLQISSDGSGTKRVKNRAKSGITKLPDVRNVSSFLTTGCLNSKCNFSSLCYRP